MLLEVTCCDCLAVIPADLSDEDNTILFRSLLLKLCWYAKTGSFLIFNRKEEKKENIVFVESDIYFATLNMVSDLLCLHGIPPQTNATFAFRATT